VNDTVDLNSSDAQNRETINSTRKVAVSSNIFMTTSVTRMCFTTQHKPARPRPQCARPRQRPFFGFRPVLS